MLYGKCEFNIISIIRKWATMHLKNLRLVSFLLVSAVLIFCVDIFAAEQELKPVFLDKLPETIFPRSAKPSDPLYVYNAMDCDEHAKTLLTTSQGIINRDIPQLYLIYHHASIPSLVNSCNKDEVVQADIAWLDWLKKNDYLKRTVKLNSPEEVLRRFGINKAVIVDPNFPATLNIACMIASVEGVAVAYPEQVEKFGLEVIEDLRGKWKTNSEAYQWAFDNLWPKMNQTIIGCLTPAISSHTRDYLVAKKVFTIWLGNTDLKTEHSSENELDVMKSMLGKMPVNIPIIGYPWHGDGSGIGEGPGVTLLSNYAKYLVAENLRTNLTVWTGLEGKTKEYKQHPPRDIKLENDKVYATFLISDGSNMNMWLDFVPGKNYWASPYRGKIPLAWTIGPSMIDLQAPVLDYYYSSLTQMDSFGSALCGISYMYPQFYGTVYGDKQRDILNDYLKISNNYMKKLYLNWIWTTFAGEHNGQILTDYTNELDDIEVIFEGYGRQWWKDEPYEINGIPIFHFMNDAYGMKKTLEETMQNLPTERPAFISIFIQNWPFTLEMLNEMQKQLGDEFVFVRPDELATLYKKSKAGSD
jgi:hypothetical protein